MSETEWESLKSHYACDHEICVQRVPAGDQGDEKVITRPRKYYLIANLHVASETKCKILSVVSLGINRQSIETFTERKRSPMKHERLV